MPSPLPRWNRKVHLSLSSSAISAFPEIMAGRLPHHVFRGLLSVHSRYGLHTHQVTFMTLYTGGFSRFVTSTTAPIATGWNESCRAGFAPAGKPCLCTAHMIKDVIIHEEPADSYSVALVRRSPRSSQIPATSARPAVSSDLAPRLVSWRCWLVSRPSTSSHVVEPSAASALPATYVSAIVAIVNAELFVQR